jgi:hypothetical protein
MVGGNSGIQYRSAERPQKWVVMGYQMEVSAEPKMSGFIYGEQFRGDLCMVGDKVVWGKDGKKQVVGKVGDQAEIATHFKVGDWNDYCIVARGNHIVQYLNGIQTVDLTDEDPKAMPSGIIALQIHAGYVMTVDFKNIRLKTFSKDAEAKPASSSAAATIPAGYTGKPYGGKAHEIPGIIQAEDYDIAPNNENDVTFHYNGSGPNGGTGLQADRGGRKGEYRTTADSIGIIKYGGGHVSITGEKENPDQFYLGSTHDGEWMKYTVHVAEAGTYRFGGKLAATGKESKLSVAFTPTLKIGPVSIPTTAGFQPRVETYHVWLISDNLGEVTLPAGDYVMQITLEKSGEKRGGSNLDY